MTTNVTVEVSFNGADLLVKGDYSPHQPAKIYAPAEDCYPEEPGEFDVEAVIVGGVDITELLMDAYLPKLDGGKFVLGRCVLDEIADRAYEKADAQ